MDFKKAEDLKRKNGHLIGKKDNSATIDELILVPTDASIKEKFLTHYLQILDGDEAIRSFIGVDVDIVAVFDKGRIDGQDIFFHTSIYNLPDNLGAITE